MAARNCVFVLVAGALAYPFSGSNAWAQSVTATLVGTVFDASNAAIPNAKISLANKGTNVTRTTSSNSHGDYIIANLAPGMYQLVAEHSGFRRTIVGDMELFVNQTARLDVILQIGALAEAVEVTGQAPLVASETSSVGQVIDRNPVSYTHLTLPTIYSV